LDEQRLKEEFREVLKVCPVRANARTPIPRDQFLVWFKALALELVLIKNKKNLKALLAILDRVVDYIACSAPKMHAATAFWEEFKRGLEPTQVSKNIDHILHLARFAADWSSNMELQEGALERSKESEQLFGDKCESRVFKKEDTSRILRCMQVRGSALLTPTAPQNYSPEPQYTPTCYNYNKVARLVQSLYKLTPRVDRDKWELKWCEFTEALNRLADRHKRQTKEKKYETFEKAVSYSDLGIIRRWVETLLELTVKRLVTKVARKKYAASFQEQ